MIKKKIVHNKQTYNNLVKKHKQVVKENKEQQGMQYKEIKKLLHTYGECIVDYGCLLDVRYRTAWNFVKNRYPDADLSGINVYCLDVDKMNTIDIFRGCGGCYIPALQSIVIKVGKDTTTSNQSPLYAALAKYNASATEDDILVHELFHAVSHALNRGTRKFSHLEEEFVYKSTIEWLESIGYTKEEIIEKNFLPFVLQDVLRNNLNEIILDIASNHIDCDKFEMSGIKKYVMEFHLQELVDEIVTRARSIGRKMVGIGGQTKQLIEDRFSVLDFS